jgi:hypothetical protein
MFTNSDSEKLGGFDQIPGAVVVPGCLLLPNNLSCCAGISAYLELLFRHCCTVHLELLLFLFVLALLCCLPVITVVPGVLALLYTWSCCCSWLFWHYCAVYLLLPVIPGVLALMYTWSCCCSWLSWHFCAVYLLLLLFLVCWHCCIPGAVVVPGCFWHCCAVYLLQYLFLVCWHCCIPGAVVVPGCLGIAESLQDGVGIQNLLLQAASTLH